MVQTGGFEPPTFSSQTSRSTKLNYACIGVRDWNRTNNTIVHRKFYGILLPRQVRYQAALYAVKPG